MFCACVKYIFNIEFWICLNGWFLFKYCLLNFFSIFFCWLCHMHIKCRWTTKKKKRSWLVFVCLYCDSMLLTNSILKLWFWCVIMYYDFSIAFRYICIFVCIWMSVTSDFYTYIYVCVCLRLCRSTSVSVFRFRFKLCTFYILTFNACTNEAYSQYFKI